MTRRVIGALAFALLLGLAAPLLAQTGLTGAALAGTVHDEAGQPLEGALVEATVEALGVSRAVRTDAAGRYSVPGLPLGSYRLRVEKPGFRPLVRVAASAAIGEVVVLDLTLTVAFAEAASVEQRLDATGLAGAAVATVVDQPTIDALPANGRDYVGFALLTPGVAAERTPPTGPTTSSGLSFAGQRPRSNHVMVDGFDNDEVFTGAVAALFSQEAVQEFQVLAASAPAEFGHASGGLVNTVTRSGSNDLKGSAYLFLRDERLNAREHFERYDVFGQPVEAEKAPFRQTQWGATLGGPLRKDRTFFFLSYEKLDTAASNFVTIAPEVAGALVREGFPVDLGAAPYAIGTDSALARLDHHFAPAHRLLFRVHFSERENENVEPVGGIAASSHGVVQRRRDWGVALAQTDVFGSGWLSEARLQVVRGSQRVDALDPRCEASCQRVDEGGPEVTLSGLAVVGRQLNTPQARANLGVQVSETVTRTRGRHTVKAGFELDFTERDGLFAQDFGGRYVFTALPAVPGVRPALGALQAFEQGLPAVYFQGYGETEGGGRSRAQSLFAQDHWRLTPRLDLVAGLRYQRFDPGLSGVRVSDLAGTTLAYDVKGRGDFDPRLSLSYALGRRASLRAAYGVFHEDPLLAVAFVTDIVNGRDLRLLRAGLPVSAAAWSSPGRRLPEPAAALPSVVQVAGPGFRAPYSRQLSVGWTQELRRGLRASVDFIAVEGRDQIGIVDYNPLVPALGPLRRPNDAAGAPGTSTSVNQFTNYGESSYRGLAVSLHQRLGARGEIRASYTLARDEDLGSDMFGQPNVAEDAGFGRDPGDPAGWPRGFAPDAFRGPSALDQRHRFVLSGFASLPWDFSLSGIVTLGSGRPYTALAGVDFNGDGIAVNDRARRDPQDAASRVGRNAQRMAGLATVDARLSRRFALARGAGLEVLVEAFNLLDRANYSDVNNVFGPGRFPDEPARDSAGRVTYGLYTKAYPPRQVQVAARLTF